MLDCHRWAEQWDPPSLQTGKFYNEQPYDEPIHQHVCEDLFDTYCDTINSITAYKCNLTYKIKNIMPELLPNKHSDFMEQMVHKRHKWGILLVLSGLASLEGVIIKGLNLYLNHKRNAAMSNTIKQLYENDRIFHDQMLIMQNRRALLAKMQWSMPLERTFINLINN